MTEVIVEQPLASPGSANYSGGCSLVYSCCRTVSATPGLLLREQDDMSEADKSWLVHGPPADYKKVCRSGYMLVTLSISRQEGVWYVREQMFSLGREINSNHFILLNPFHYCRDCEHAKNKEPIHQDSRDQFCDQN